MSVDHDEPFPFESRWLGHYESKILNLLEQLVADGSVGVSVTNNRHQGYVLVASISITSNLFLMHRENLSDEQLRDRIKQALADTVRKVSEILRQLDDGDLSHEPR